MKLNILVIIEKDEDGYFAYVPSIQGCYSQGDTYEAVVSNITDAIKINMADYKKDKDMTDVVNRIKSITSSSVTNIGVTV